jgi:hypothetical protein
MSLSVGVEQVVGQEPVLDARRVLEERREEPVADVDDRHVIVASQSELML